jgi:hypothetical protein
LARAAIAGAALLSWLVGGGALHSLATAAVLAVYGADRIAQSPVDIAVAVLVGTFYRHVPLPVIGVVALVVTWRLRRSKRQTDDPHCVVDHQGTPVFTLTPSADLVRWQRIAENQETASGDHYERPRMRIFPPIVRAAWTIEYPAGGSTPALRWRRRKHEVWTWHGSTFESLTSIAAFGFQNISGLGKLYGDGIYQSSVPDTALFYCSKYYQQRSPYFVLLSKTTYDTSTILSEYRQNQEMSVDVHLVSHTQGGRIGTPGSQKARSARSWYDVRKWLPSSKTGIQVSGDEVVARNGELILPVAILAIDA